MSHRRSSSSLYSFSCLIKHCTLLEWVHCMDHYCNYLCWLYKMMANDTNNQNNIRWSWWQLHTEIQRKKRSIILFVVEGFSNRFIWLVFSCDRNMVKKSVFLCFTAKVGRWSQFQCPDNGSWTRQTVKRIHEKKTTAKLKYYSPSTDRLVKRKRWNQVLDLFTL